MVWFDGLFTNMNKGCVKNLGSVLILTTFILLSGCGFNRSPKYIPPETQVGRQCIQICEQSRSACEDSCGVNARACFARARAQARQAHQDYIANQEEQRRRSARTLASFYNPRDCNVSYGCNCEQEYRACYKLCGGEVR